MASGQQRYDLAVIGGGPGGYVAAIRAAQLGLKTACIERDNTLGGTCVNVGCIPSKALLDSSELFATIRDRTADHGIHVAEPSIDVARMMQRKDEVVDGMTRGVELLFRQNKIDWIRGSGRLTSVDRVAVETADGPVEIGADKIIVATGSEPVPFPGVPFDEERVLSSTGALALAEVPEHLIVIGGGVIGLELGSVWLRLGAQVTVVELMPAILPGFDQDMVKAAERAFKRQGFTFHTGTKVQAIEVRDDGVTVAVEGKEPIAGDRLLVAIGRRPYTEGLGLDVAGITPDKRGFIQVDDRYHTGVGQIYAIGDVIGGQMLAHKAEEEGIAAVENLAGKRGHVNYSAVPSVVYTWPEIAAVGMTEAAAREAGREVRVGKFLFRANGRARAMGETDGLVKVIADADSDRLLGLHICGPRASDLIAEAALAMEFSASAEDIAISVHAHPTLPEAVKEAALAALGRSIHS